MRPLLVSVEEQWDTSCQLKGKGGVSFAHLPEVWVPLRMTNAPHPVAALPHYPLKLIRTGEGSKEACKLQFIPLLFKAAASPRTGTRPCSEISSLPWKWTTWNTEVQFACFATHIYIFKSTIRREASLKLWYTWHWCSHQLTNQWLWNVWFICFFSKYYSC